MRFRCTGRLQSLRIDDALVVERGKQEQFAGDECVAGVPLRQFVGQVEQARQIVGDIAYCLPARNPRQPFQLLRSMRCRSTGTLTPACASSVHDLRRAASCCPSSGAHQVQTGFQHVVVAAHRQALRVGERLLEARGEFVCSAFL